MWISLSLAARENRVVLTFDKDFGEIALRSNIPAACGIVLFRLRMPLVAEAPSRLASIINARDDWTGHFSVVEPGRVRMRKLT
jgi:hypothetical protein